MILEKTIYPLCKVDWLVIHTEESYTNLTKTVCLQKRPFLNVSNFIFILLS